MKECILNHVVARKRETYKIKTKKQKKLTELTKKMHKAKKKECDAMVDDSMNEERSFSLCMKACVAPSHLSVS